MSVMILGLALFLGIHLVPAAPSVRERLVQRLGENRYKGAYSLASLAGLILIVAGYILARPGPQLFPPVPVASAAAPIAVTLAFILFAAANMPTHIRARLKHPMLIGLLLWSLVHLLANGDLRGTVLFGSIFVFAVVDLVSAVRRHAVKSFVPRASADLGSVVGGVAIALIVMTLHRVLFGPAVVSFGV